MLKRENKVNKSTPAPLDSDFRRLVDILRCALHQSRCQHDTHCFHTQSHLTSTGNANTQPDLQEAVGLLEQGVSGCTLGASS